MKIVYQNSPESFPVSVCALGAFDGVHKGHAALLSAAKNAARKSGAQCAVFTFCPVKAPFINTDFDRFSIFEMYGVDAVYAADFQKMRTMSPVEFVSWLKNTLGAVGVVCGQDFRFGKDAFGDVTDLRRLCKDAGIEVTVVPFVRTPDDVPISSTRVRALLGGAEIEEAASLLGHSFFLSGEVVHGKSIGHALGFPTLNLDFPEGLTPIPAGVYFSRSLIDGKAYPSITNIGRRPTFGKGEQLIETHVPDAELGDCYGKKIVVEFLHFRRPEAKFPSIEQLKAYVSDDLDAWRSYFQNQKS